MAAGTAMTIAHAGRFTGHCELDRATETTSVVAFWTAHTAFFLSDGRTDHVGGALLTFGARGHYSLVSIIAARRYSFRLPPAAFSNSFAEMPNSAASATHSVTVSSSCSRARGSA